MRRFLVGAWGVTAVFLAFSNAAASPETVYVPGTACVYFAGQDPGASIWMDSLPANAPVGGRVSGARRISVTATGLAGSGYTPDIGPSGSQELTLTSTDYEKYGISIPGFPIGLAALIGVFLTDATPTPRSLPGRLTEITSTPDLQQAFWIGAGPIFFYPPAGATRLFLGTHDGSDWSNNQGGFQVTVDIETCDSQGALDAAYQQGYQAGLAAGGLCATFDPSTTTIRVPCLTVGDGHSYWFGLQFTGNGWSIPDYGANP
jgi:hypothetical protein